MKTLPPPSAPLPERASALPLRRAAAPAQRQRLSRAPWLRGLALLVSTWLLSGWLLSGLLLGLQGTAFAQGFAQENSLNVSFAAPPKESVPVYVLAGQSVLIVFDQPIGRLAVSNSDVAEAVLVAPNQMMINGKVSGRVTFTAWSKDTTSFVFFNVDVRVNLAQLDSQVRALFPNMDIRLSQANGAVVISGSIPPAVMKQVEEVVKAAGYKTVNLTGQQVENIAQVQLNVKVAEVARNKLSEFAYTPVYQRQAGQGGYTNTGSGPYSIGSVDAGTIVGTVASSLNVFFMTNNVYSFLRALQTQGVLRALAEPNLVAMDGQSASFLAGGEIPVPLIQGANGAASIVWKEYGVRLNFKPTILDEQHIRLDIEPEVSSLDFANAVRFEGFLIPALRVRRAKTGIELQNGQTFGIAGLLDNSETKSFSKMPILADVPILGNLFKSKSFQRNETELVFIVNTKIVKPWNPDEVPAMKAVDGLGNGSPLGVTPPDADDKKDKDKDSKNKDSKDKDAGHGESHGEKPDDAHKAAEPHKADEHAAKPEHGAAHETKPSAAPAHGASEHVTPPAEKPHGSGAAEPAKPADAHGDGHGAAPPAGTTSHGNASAPAATSGEKGHEAKGHEAKGHEATGHEAKGHEATGHEAKGHEATGHEDAKASGKAEKSHEAEKHGSDKHDAGTHEAKKPSGAHGETPGETHGEAHGETKEHAPKPAAPAHPAVKPAFDRHARPEQAVQALQWKLKIPATATVTAQTRP